MHGNGYKVLEEWNYISTIPFVDLYLHSFALPYILFYSNLICSLLFSYPQQFLNQKIVIQKTYPRYNNRQCFGVCDAIIKKREKKEKGKGKEKRRKKGEKKEEKKRGERLGSLEVVLRRSKMEEMRASQSIKATYPLIKPPFQRKKYAYMIRVANYLPKPF
jgi:hypothetical protein